MTALRIGLVGLGKIARDQHLPSIAKIPGARLVAVASRNAKLDGVANHPTIDAMLEREAALNTVVLCQPPQARFDAAWRALAARKHVFLEKPPGATLAEVEALADYARRQGVTLFASWHSRFAPGVEAARSWLAGRALRNVSIQWREDVRHWHPGQDWIWQPGGFGVFDPGINALSILTSVVSSPILVTGANLEVPSNRHAPIGAMMTMRTVGGASVTADFDFRQTGLQTWDIAFETASGGLLLSQGGHALAIDGADVATGLGAEYEAMYLHFAKLVETGASDVDISPLRLVSDAFLCGRHTAVEPFVE